LSAELIANVVIAGILTGLVYGLMALGLSVIFGVVRVVNFAHGEMMTVAMYAATVLFAELGLDPFLAILPDLHPTRHPSCHPCSSSSLFIGPI